MKNVFLLSLGCDKNTVDAQYILGDLLTHGFAVTQEPEEAELIIVNTCCFIEAAKEESVNAILDCIPYKDERCEKLIVSGCMAERYKKELEEEIPEIDGFIGVKDTQRILSLFGEETNTAPVRYIDAATASAYLKISDGCDRNCTYCAIPGIRGKHKSRTPEDVFAEAKRLEDAGIQELILIAQDLTQYGKDLNQENGDKPADFSALLTRLAEDFSFKWIRLLYLYPEGIDDALLETIASHQNILPYFDLPVQHLTDDILRRMGRHISYRDIQNKVEKIRAKLPDAVLRTSIITAFPGETEEEHALLLERMKELRFDRLGAFRYSREEGTPAAEFPDQISEEISQRRWNEISSLQNDIMQEQNERYTGRILDCIIEEQEDEQTYSGRLYCDAPEIDCIIYVNSSKALQSGDFCKVKVLSALGYDLIGDLYESAE